MSILAGLAATATAILISGNASAQLKQDDVEQMLCREELYRNATPSCARFNTPQQKAVDGWYQAGSAAFKAVQLEAVIANFKKVVEADPNYKEVYFAYFGIGFAYSAKRQYAEAIPYFDKAIAREPTIAMAYRGRGVAHSELGNANAAIADLDRAIKLEPKDAAAYTARARHKLIRNDYAGARTDLDRALELNPRDSRAFYGRAVTFGHAGNYDQALADLTKAIEIEPGFASAYSERGIMYFRMGKPDAARDAFNAALKINSADKRAQQGLEALDRKKN